MSAQSAKKKRLGSRRRISNQNDMSTTDDSHETGSAFVAQPHIPEENTDLLNVLANSENSPSETQHPPSPELLGNRRKLGSRRRNKEHVEDSVTESCHEPREEVEHTTRGLAMQLGWQADNSPDYSSEAQNVTTSTCSAADLESFSSKGENLQEENETDSEVISESCKFVKTMQEGIDKSDRHNEEVKESAHLVGISELTSLSVLLCPTVDQQLIDQSNCREKLTHKPNVGAVKENEGKERDDNTELFSTELERTTENTEMECSVQQGTISSPKDSTKVKQNEHFNSSDILVAHSEYAVSEVYENETTYTSESRMHDAIENSKISGNRMNQTEVCETNQFKLIVKNIHDSPTSHDISIPDSIQDRNVEALEWRNEVYHGYDTNETQISGIERVDTGLSQVFEMEGRVEGDTEPRAEQTGHLEQEGLLSIMEETASSLQIMQSEINVPFDSQTQQNETSFNSESDHEPTEDVVGNIGHNETLETTEMTLTIETARQEKSTETLLEETNKFDTAQTEDDTDQVKANAQDGALVGIGNLNSLDLQSGSTLDQKMIEQSNFREMPDEEVLNVCSVTEKENKEIDKNTDWFRQDDNLQGKYLVSQDLESSITPEITTEQHSSREHTEPECSVEQEIVSSPKEELYANEEQNKFFNLPKVEGDYHSEVAVNKLHEQDVEPTENQEMPELDYLSESVILDATENSEIISGNLMNQTEVSDTFLSTLTVKDPDDSPINQDRSNLDNIQDEHPTEENHFEASEQKNKDYHVYESREPQISDIERVDTALSQVFEMEGRVEGDTEPRAEQTGQQEQEGLLFEKEASTSSLQTMQSEINVPFDSQPQPNNTSFNSIGNRRKLGSSRRNKGRQHVKDSVAESDHEPTDDVESTKGNEAFKTVQMSLPIERTSHEELSQESLNDIMPATHDSSSYSAITSDYSSEVQSPTLKHSPEAVLESLIPKSENLQEDYDERENDFKVEVSDKSVEATLEGADQSDTLQSQEFKGDYHSEVAVNKLHEQEVKPTENQEMLKLDYSSERVTHNTPENSEHISENPKDETDVSDTYQSTMKVKNPDDSLTNQDNSNPDNIQHEHPTEENHFEASEERNKDYHGYESREPHISDIERVDTALSQVFEMEDRVEGDTEPRAEQTGQQELEGLLSEKQASSSSLQTMQSEINVPLDSQPQPNNTSFTSIGNKRKLGSSRRNRGRRHVKDSVAEPDHEPTEDVIGNIGDNEPLETTEMTFIIETAVQRKSTKSLLEETDKFNTAQTEVVTGQVKENAQYGTLFGIGNLNSLGLQSSSTLDQQMIERSNFREMPDEDVPNVCSVTEKENKERKEDPDWFRQDGNSQGKYLVIESHVKSEDIESSITLEINTERKSPREHNEIECSVEQADFSSSEEKLSINEEQKEHVILPQVRGTWHSQEAINKVHEDEIKPTQMQERHQIDNISINDRESNLQKLQPEMNAPLDSQPLDNSQNITEQTHQGFNPTGNGIKLGSSQRNGRLHVQDTVGNVPIKDCKTGAEHTMYVEVYEHDEDGAQFEDPTKKENKAQEINVSKEMCSAPHNKTNATIDIDLKDETLRAEPAVDMSGISSEKTNVDDSGNLQGRSKQKRRKMGSTRHAQLNRKPEEERVETERDREADMRNLDKMEVVEELTVIATVEVLQNESAKPSLSLVYKEQMEPTETSTVDGMGQRLQSSDLQSNVMSDIDYSKAFPPEQSGSNNEDVVDPVKFVHVADVSDSERNVDGSVEPSQIDEMHDQALKSTEALVLADLEIVKSVVKGGAGEEHMTAGVTKQEPDNANDGAHNKKEMKNTSSYLDTSSRRRKMGSTRKNLGTGTKQEDLHQKQDVNDEATETATNVRDARTESFSSIIKAELQLDGKHKDGGSETIEYSHSGESHKSLAHQTFEENPVSQGQLLVTEPQLTPSDLPVMPSTSPKHDLISESAPGGRRRKMGSHRKSHGHQNSENQTRDTIKDTQNEKDVKSIGEESAIKTEELKEECLALDKISKVDKSPKKLFTNLSTSKEGEQPRPVSEKTTESVTPVQQHYAERQQKLSLVSRADLRSNAYNVMMVGDSSVGKTSFMKRAQSGKFSLDIPASIGLDSCMWTVVVEGRPVVLQLWDTAGQERFHSITRQIFHKADAFLLMYDITSSQSFSAVSYWASCIQEGAAESVTILLVGNKSDRAERQVQTQDAEILAKEYNFEFIECSAATGENVVQSLETVARMLSPKVDTRDDTMVLNKEPQPKTSRCC